MIHGLHVLLYSRDPDAVRAFFRDVLGFPAVDAGGGWLIFACPPAELAAHPTDGADFCKLYLMSDDLDATLRTLTRHGVTAKPVQTERWGRVTWIRIPGDVELGLYEPRHKTALGLKKTKARKKAKKSAPRRKRS
jgi:catechol 2,3-dioxygenase-like lactoylglutathione lyase family enzyme